MPSFDLTISNYRCFSANMPARLEMRPRILALVGPNNAGKSTLLRLFYEIRPVFALLLEPGVVQNLANGFPHGVQLLGIGDPMEIFHNANNLPARMEIRILESAANQLSGVDFIFDRKTPHSITAHFTVGPAHDKIVFPNSTFPGATVTGTALNVDTSLLRAVGAQLARTHYMPATRVAIGESQGNVYDLQIGNSFISLWDQWKTGAIREQNDAIQRVTEDIRRLFNFGRLEITATPDKRDFHVAVDGQSFKLRELGGGLAQFVIVLANVAVKKPSWLLIDEPEISLHPSLQLDFLTTLASYAEEGTIFATHSLALARTADCVVSVRRDGNRSVVKPFEETPSFQEFLGEMSFAAYRDIGFDAVLAVEGVNDIKTVQQFLRLLGKDHRVVVLQLGGSQMIRPQRAQELSETLRLTRNVHVLIDSERTQAGAPLTQVRSEFLTACGGLKIRSAATERRAIEHYISNSAAKLAFGEKYRALSEFEDRGSGSPTWGKSETWRAAREMTKDELLQTDVGQFLDSI